MLDTKLAIWFGYLATVFLIVALLLMATGHATIIPQEGSLDLLSVHSTSNSQ